MSRSDARLPRERERDKRRIYQLLLTLIALAFWLVVLINLYFHAIGAFYGMICAIVAGFVTLLGILSYRREVPLPRIEAALLLCGVVAFSLVLWHALYVEAAGPLSAPAVAAFMWMPVIYLLLYLALPDRTALRYSFAVELLMVALTWQQLIDAFRVGGRGEIAFVLFQVYLAHAALIGALYVIASYQRRFRTMQATASAMRRLANTDALTSLGNRRALEQVLDDEVRRAERYHRPLSVILADIDDFKLLNDRYGHPAGDRVLVDLGNRLEHSVRSADRVGRWGGEEFLILTPETRLESAVKLAEVVRTHIADSTLGDDHSVSLSFGVASHCPGDTAADLIGRADAALYLAKRSGKNRVVTEREIER